MVALKPGWRKFNAPKDWINKTEPDLARDVGDASIALYGFRETHRGREVYGKYVVIVTSTSRGGEAAIPVSSYAEALEIFDNDAILLLPRE